MATNRIQSCERTANLQNHVCTSAISFQDTKASSIKLQKAAMLQSMIQRQCV